MPERWFAVETKPNCERKALKRLEDQAFDVWMPETLEFRTRSGRQRMVHVRVPFFRRYLFARFDLNETVWTPIKNTIGVLRIVAQPDGRPMAIPVGWIEALKLHAAAHGGLIDEDDLLRRPRLKKRTRTGVEIGQQVRVVDGPFTSFNGIIDEITRDYAKSKGIDAELKVFVHIFGRATPVHMTEAQLEAA